MNELILKFPCDFILNLENEFREWRVAGFDVRPPKNPSQKIQYNFIAKCQYICIYQNLPMAQSNSYDTNLLPRTLMQRGRTRETIFCLLGLAFLFLFVCSFVLFSFLLCFCFCSPITVIIVQEILAVVGSFSMTITSI